MTDDHKKLRDACKVLGVGERATLQEIKARYRRLAMESHPDVAAVVTEGRIYAVNAAYRLIMCYIDAYRFSFAEEEFLVQNPVERLRRQFGTDPICGKE